MEKELQEIRDTFAEEFTHFYNERGADFDNNLDRATIKFLINKIVRMELRLTNLEAIQK